MAMKRRILRVTLEMPYGDEVLTEGLDIRVRVFKAALRIQNRATIEVYGLTTQLRESLISQFTAWKNRLRQIGQEAEYLINVRVEAGYATGENVATARVFSGQVTTVELLSTPPDIGIKLNCYTQQIDRSKTIRNMPPARATFLQFVQWGAKEMGLNYICDTSYNDRVLINPGRSISVAAAIPIILQDMYMPDVAAFVDDDTLIVKDRDRVIRPENAPHITEFVGIPSWTEWGVEFTILFSGDVTLAGGVSIASMMNPSIEGNYVITSLEYDLSSRSAPFYVKVSGSPPA